MPGIEANLSVGDVIVQTAALTRNFAPVIAVDHVTAQKDYSYLLRFHHFAQVRFSAAGEHRLADFITQVQDRLEISSTGHERIEDFDVDAPPAWKPLVASKN